MPSNNKVLAYLHKEKSITSMEAYDRLLNTRLASSIHNLRKKGYVIDTEMMTSESGRPYAKYTLISSPV